MTTNLTNDQITAGAAVLCDHGQPIGRNAAITAFDAMCAPSPQIAEKVELPPLPEKWVNFMRNLANLQPEVYTAHGLLTVTRAFCNTAADLLAAQPAEGAGQASLAKEPQRDFKEIAKSAGQAGQVPGTDDVAARQRHRAHSVWLAVERRMHGCSEEFIREAYCTCPSGDGSLRWPCPVHPATERAAAPAEQPSAQVKP